MKRLILLAILSVSAATAAMPLAIAPAEAQVPPRNGPWGDRDRDGIPNAYDRRDNRQSGAWGDRDHDGIPNAYDRFDNRALRDKDHDGVAQAWDRNDRNPYVR